MNLSGSYPLAPTSPYFITKGTDLDNLLFVSQNCVTGMHLLEATRLQCFPSMSDTATATTTTTTITTPQPLPLLLQLPPPPPPLLLLLLLLLLQLLLLLLVVVVVVVVVRSCFHVLCSNPLSVLHLLKYCLLLPKCQSLTPCSAVHLSWASVIL